MDWVTVNVMLSLPKHRARIVLTIELLPHARCFGKLRMTFFLGLCPRYWHTNWNVPRVRCSSSSRRPSVRRAMLAAS